MGLDDQGVVSGEHYWKFGKRWGCVMAGWSNVFADMEGKLGLLSDSSVVIITLSTLESIEIGKELFVVT